MKTPHRVYTPPTGAIIVIWLLLSVGGALIWWNAALTAIHADFNRDVLGVYSQLSRKLDQNEAVLSALVAQSDNAQPGRQEMMRRFARRMVEHYPQLYTIEYFEKVTPGNRGRYHDLIRHRAGAGFFLRNNDVPERKQSLEPPARSVYLAVSVIEPDLPKAAMVYGYDVLHDPYFADDVKRAVSSGKMTASLPFELFEGGRVFLLMRALYLNDKVVAAESPAFQGIVAVVVHFDLMLRELHLERLPLDISLASRNGHTALLSTNDNAHGDWLSLGRLTWQKTLPSQSQPFELRVERELQIGDFQLLPLAALEALLALSCLLGWKIFLQRRALEEARYMADESLYLQRERAAVTLNAIYDGVVSLSIDESVELVNPMAQQLLERSELELVGRHYRSVLLLSNELADSLIEDPVSICLRTGALVELPEHTILTTAAGNARLVEGAVAPLFALNGELSGAVCAFRDLGPVRMRARQALEASEKRVKEHLEKLSHVARLHTMGEMASGIAHELNQPLSAITSYCQASLSLLQESEADPEILRALGAAVAQAGRAAEIIKRLRVFVSKRQSETRLIDLNQVIDNSLFLAEHDLREGGVEVKQKLSPRPVAVLADSIQMEQVILNLLGNAIDALRDEPVGRRSIEILSRLDGGRAVLEIRDSGRGISPQVRDVLFHPFFSTKSQGMGLGLSICQTIVEQYRGSISAENIAGSGAAFRIVLPAAG
ncbi:ATP-binding protein [Paludibacterium yongneupense]|uniref:ATP-binding protein n=1 Tax=Paludibacterium yongneupense TaxID=400061 RepID=UPI00040BFC82|nr:ATP-binding protein [Paludibacterium yongneupense]